MKYALALCCVLGGLTPRTLADATHLLQRHNVAEKQNRVWNLHVQEEHSFLVSQKSIVHNASGYVEPAAIERDSDGHYVITSARKQLQIIEAPPGVFPPHPRTVALARALARQLERESFSQSDPVVFIDAGIGAGTFSSIVAEVLPPGSHIVGIDIEPRAVEAARSNLQRNVPKGISFEVHEGNLFKTLPSDLRQKFPKHRFIVFTNPPQTPVPDVSLGLAGPFGISIAAQAALSGIHYFRPGPTDRMFEVEYSYRLGSSRVLDSYYRRVKEVAQTDWKIDDPTTHFGETVWEHLQKQRDLGESKFEGDSNGIHVWVRLLEGKQPIDWRMLDAVTMIIQQTKHILSNYERARDPTHVSGFLKASHDAQPLGQVLGEQDRAHLSLDLVQHAWWQFEKQRATAFPGLSVIPIWLNGRWRLQFSVESHEKGAGAELLPRVFSSKNLSVPRLYYDPVGVAPLDMRYFPEDHAIGFGTEVLFELITRPHIFAMRLGALSAEASDQ